VEPSNNVHELSSTARRSSFAARFSLPLSRRKMGAVLASALALSVAVVAIRHRATRPAPPVLGRMEAFSLYDQRGKTFGLDDLDGTIWIADFIFTGCQAACPMLTSKMRALQKHIEERERTLGHHLPVRLVSFSVDPEVDTPDKLAAYAAKWGADQERWSFLTGPLAEVNRAVTRSLKIPFEKGGADTSAFDVMHGEHFVMVDGQRRIRGYFETDPAGMAELKAALESLLAEKG
jgi:protein SCO1/2